MSWVIPCCGDHGAIPPFRANMSWTSYLLVKWAGSSDPLWATRVGGLGLNDYGPYLILPVTVSNTFYREKQ
jgi:hypothetical protein